MSKNLTFIFFLALISAFSINSLEAQSKSEKKVTIVKKVIDKDGKETIERIEATGAEAEKYLQELESVEGESIDIDVNINGGDNNTSISQKKYKIKVLDEEGNEKVLEWNGEGDMPAEMQKVMKEHDIDSANLQDDSKEGKKIVKMKFIEEDGEVHDLESHGINVKRKEIMNADGSKTIEVEVEDMESAGAQTIEVEVSNSGMADEEIIVEVIEENNNKAQLGVMIENAPDGVTIKSGQTIDEVLNKYNYLFDILGTQSECRTTEKKETKNEEKKIDIQSLALNNFALFPNPTNHSITLRFESTPGELDIFINDTNGALIYEEHIANFSGRFDKLIDLSHSSNGLLVLSIVQNGNVFAEQIYFGNK